METQLPAVPTTAVVEHRGEHIHLTAETPLEMRTSQVALIGWCEQKIAAEQADHAEMQAAYEHAVKHKWKSSALKNAAYRAGRRVQFYEKVKAALEAGYYIVPNFPVQMFAVRRAGKSKVYGNIVETNSWGRPDFKQDAAVMPAGEGDYKNPFPLVRMEKNAGGDGKSRYWPSGWDDLEFPVEMAKPRIMEATNRAMALRVFDEIGVLPAHKREDPVIVGTIIKPDTGYARTKLSFIICWHINTKMI